MKKSILLVSLFMIGLTSKAQYYHNPVLAGFYPDPSICKAGDDYYIVNSTFSYFPGLPIFHSKDLLNWQLESYALDRPEQLPLEGAPLSSGLFAPTIRYHNGTFYIVCTNVSGVGNFVVTAKNTKGPWSNPVKLPEVNGIDPSLFFDGDSAYIVYNSIPPDGKPLYEGHRTIRVVPFSEQSLQVAGSNRILVNGGTDISQKPIWIEGPHLYKINGWYYLMCAQGGTGYNHSEVVFRSRSMEEPFVPYQHNPILTQMFLPKDRKSPVTSTGHADLVQDNAGSWWAVFLGCRPYTGENYNTGRETFMAPVKWENGWPVIDLKGEEVKYRYPINAGREEKWQTFNGNFTFRDDFKDRVLNSRYAFLRTPLEKWYSLNDTEGTLALQLRPATCSGRSNPSFVGFRQSHLKGHAATELQFTPTAENEKAGLLVFQSENRYYFISKSVKDSKPVLELWKSNGNPYKKINTVPSVLLASVPLPDTNAAVQLKIEANNSVYNFYYKLQEQDWKALQKNVDAKYLSTSEAGGFVGCMYAMYATSEGKPSTQKAYFKYFENVNNDDVYKK
ncbi:MAG: glycoside hydrolase family 43 protein [Chitinophagaceae bacterium]